MNPAPPVTKMRKRREYRSVSIGTPSTAGYTHRALTSQIPTPAYDADFKEYDDAATIQRYRRATAGDGIRYLLSASYGPLFLEAARDAIRETGAKALRIVEFGCGAGMAIHYLVEALRREGVDVELAVGADFVPAMIGAA